MAGLNGKQRTPTSAYPPKLSSTIVVHPGSAAEFGRRPTAMASPRALLSEVLRSFPTASVVPYFRTSVPLGRADGATGLAAAATDLERHLRISVQTRAEAVDILAKLGETHFGEYAYIEAGPTPPPVQPADDTLSPSQGYLNASPEGINARFAWTRTDGAGVTLVDLEQGWTLNHEDLAAASIELLSGESLYFHGHGTAVLGQIFGADNTLGIIGKAPGARAKVVSQWRSPDNYSTAQAIASAVAAMAPGDVLLLEAQVEGTSTGDYLPVEVEPIVFRVILEATRKGIVVVEAAGNGGVDLDNYKNGAGKRIFRRGSPDFQDSGAIMVGAATSATPHSRWGASNYGSRIDCFGWGEHICTTGDGWEGQDPREYTFDFAGTSGASPMIAGAAVLLQSMAKARGQFYPPRALRALLANPELNTLSLDPKNDKIGCMPDLKRLIESEE